MSSRTRFVVPALLSITCLVAPASGQEAKKEVKWTKTASGLQFHDSKEGTGPLIGRGQQASVHYTGWLYENGKKGAKFDSSVDRGNPFSFVVGAGQVIKGWDEGVGSMKVGSKRTLIIPPDLGYGARGSGGLIPPNATLMFDVELLDARDVTP